MDKPDVDVIEGLSPAISIDQKSASRNPRSTVGTITEVYDYLRLLYARIGVQHCPNDGTRLAAPDPQQIVDRILELPEGTRFQVLAPVVRGRKGEYDTLLADLAGQGFVRARIDGEVVDIASSSRDEKLARYEQHTHRGHRRPPRAARRHRAAPHRLAGDRAALAEGVAEVELVARDGTPRTNETLTFSQHLVCPKCGTSYDELAPRNFSFNSPYGACELRRPGHHVRGRPRAGRPRPRPVHQRGRHRAVAQRAHAVLHPHARSRRRAVTSIDLDAPYRTLTAKQQKVILHGVDGNLQVKYKNRYGRTRSTRRQYEGVVPWIKRRHEGPRATGPRAVRGLHARGAVPDVRRRPAQARTLAVTIDDKHIAEVCDMAIGESSRSWPPRAQRARPHDRRAGHQGDQRPPRLPARRRARLPHAVTARRHAGRWRGAAHPPRQPDRLGLVGTLYVLDEPSIGLHQRDNRRLIDTLLRLRDLGNTVLVVEHDEDTIREADWIVDIGPGAGEHGGAVVYSGTVKGSSRTRSRSPASTSAGKRSIPVPQQRRTPGTTGWRSRAPASTTCATSTSTSRSAASSPSPACRAGQEHPGQRHPAAGADAAHLQVEGAAGRHKRSPASSSSTRSSTSTSRRSVARRGPTRPPTPACSTHPQAVRQTTEAKVRGYLPGRFSFNVAGGRCEACSGDGTIKIEMHFLPDVYVPCEVCKGARYNRDTLDIEFKGKNIAEVLDMPCEEAVEFFANQPAIARHMQTLVDVGLGYVRLGQPAPTLSGGEAQRVKLATELAKRNHRPHHLPARRAHHRPALRGRPQAAHRARPAGRPGQHGAGHRAQPRRHQDRRLDHRPRPEGGSGGGLVIAEGSPEHVATVDGSHTGRFLKPLLDA
jgi:excinuclease ABC subunit A